jgi:hypothetical protein
MENTIEKPLTQYKNDKPLGETIAAAKNFGNRAVSVAGEQITRVADITEHKVKEYPLAAVGIALGSGVALGAIVTALLMPKPQTFADRVYDMELGKTFRKLLDRFF